MKAEIAAARAAVRSVDACEVERHEWRPQIQALLAATDNLLRAIEQSPPVGVLPGVSVGEWEAKLRAHATLSAEDRATVEHFREYVGGDGNCILTEEVLDLIDRLAPPPRPEIARGDQVKWWRGEADGEARYERPANAPEYTASGHIVSVAEAQAIKAACGSRDRWEFWVERVAPLDGGAR